MARVMEKENINFWKMTALLYRSLLLRTSSHPTSKIRTYILTVPFLTQGGAS